LKHYTCVMTDLATPTAQPVHYLDRRTPPHLSTLILMAGMAALSMNMFVPSLPNMAQYFAVEYGVMQLSVSLYLAASGVLQLVIGPMSDRYGRRKVVLWSLAGFILATIGTLLATQAEWFLVFRTAQAAIATAMVLSRAIVRDMVSELEAASKMGYLSMGMALVPMVAPIAGGWLDESFGWRANFWVMLVLGGAVLALVWADLGETTRARPVSFAAQFRDYPALFASRRFWGYVLSSSFTSGVFFAYLGGAPFVAIEVYGLTPTWLGIYFALVGIGYVFGNYLSGRYSMRFGVNPMVLAGTVVTLAGIAGLALFMVAGLDTVSVFFGMFVFMGIGNGMVLPNATAGMMSVRPHLAGTASGLGGAIMIGGGAALSALPAALLTKETGAWPLLGLMLVSSLGAVLSILMVIRRAREIGG